MGKGIDLKSRKTFPFMESLALRLTGSQYAAQLEEGDSTIWYLGGGYWRAVIREENNVKRAYLIDPDHTAEEIDIIEQAMTILLCGAYKKR